MPPSDTEKNLSITNVSDKILPVYDPVSEPVVPSSKNDLNLIASKPSLWILTKAAVKKPRDGWDESISRSFTSPFAIFPSSSKAFVSSVNVEFDGHGQAPTIDGGLKAWSFLVGAFMIEGIMWGFPLTFGIFQTYYQSNPPFQNNKYIPIIGTLTTGLPYLLAPLTCPIVTNYHAYQRYMIWGGWLVCILALVASSFATKIWHLAVTQGVLYGIGFQVLYYPVLSMLNEWFVKRRGLAYGIMFGAAGMCGLALPFIIEKMLNRYGYAITLRAYAITIFLLVGPTLPFLRGRLQDTLTTDVDDVASDDKIFTRAIFIAAAFSNIFQGLAFLLPFIFIPSYASHLSLSASQGALVLALANVAQIFGQIGTGYISDRANIHIPLFGSTIGSALVVFLLWGFSKGFGPLLAFGMLYGLSAGGYSVLYCRFATALTDNPKTGLFIYSIFEFERGLGSILAGPISSSLMLKGVDIGSYGIMKYERLIYFIGTALLISSLGGIGYFFQDMCFHFECIYKKYVRPRMAGRFSK